jgi:hypothetical protein
MKRGIISILFAMFVLCLWSVPAKATLVTIPYDFVQDESIVALSGYVPRIYSIEGQFVLDVDFDAGIASFYQVNATLSDEVPYWEAYGQPLPSWTNNLDVLFKLTELESVYVSDTKIDFLFERNIPGHPLSDIHLTITFMDDSLQMTGGFGAPAADGPWYSLDAAANVIPEPVTFLLLALGGIMLRRRI